MKREDIVKYSLGIITVFFAYLISAISFKNGKPTCNNYIINVYLYLAISLLLLGILSNYIPWEKSQIHPLLLFVFTIIFVILISLQNDFQKDTTQVVYSHIYYALFVLFISGTFWIYIKSPEFKPYINSTILIVSLIFVFMSMLVYTYPDFFIGTYNQAMSGLLIALLTIIFVELFNIFFTKNYAFSSTHKIISYIVILVFSLFISYDTARVFTLAEKCRNYPNYPKSSISFFLDVINLFSRIISLQSR
jgi:FtsH-binding integral membrane protein